MAAADESSPILVTGASGYIATHVVRQLLEEGYHVRGTVRDLSKEEKVKPLKELCPDAKHPLELVEADLTKEETWENALDGCKYVIHVASPFPSKSPTNAAEVDEIVKPAVDGTLTIMKACQKARISRLVLTSSTIAVYGSYETVEANKTYSEEDWAPESDKFSDTYAKSKVLAEKAAWDFLKELPEEEKFEMAVINPTFVMGPVLNNSTGTSVEICKMLLERGQPAVPKLFLPIIDVRDVAEAHVKALTVPEAAGNRHILMSHAMWMKEVAQIMAKEFKPQGYKVPTMGLPKFGVKIVGLFDKTAKTMYPQIGKSIKLETARMKDVLGITPRDVKDTVLDMCYSMIERGIAKKAKKYHGPGGKKAEEEVAENEANGEAKPAVNGDVIEEKAVNGEAEEKEEKETSEEKPAAEEAKPVAEDETEKTTESAPEEQKPEETTEQKVEEEKTEESSEQKTEESSEQQPESTEKTEE